MKKLIAIALTLVMVLGLFAACSDSKEPAPAPAPAPAEKTGYTPISILAGAMAQYTKEDAVFNISLDMAVNMTENRDMLQTMVCIPESQIGNVVAAATMMHMNPNSFTGAALELAEGVDANAFAEAVKEAIKNNQWFCGFPEKLMVATVGENFVVIAFGLDNEDAPLVSTFRDNLAAAHGDDVVILETVALEFT